MPLAAASVLDEVRGLLDAGRDLPALNALDIHLARSPQDAEARFLRGLVLSRLERTDEAIQVFSALTRDYPNLPEPYNNLAVLHAKNGHYEQARQALEAALATHSSYATAHENLGDIYSALAMASYHRAMALDEQNPDLRRKLRLMDQLNVPQPVAPPAAVIDAAREPAAAPRTPQAGEPVSAELAEAVSQAIYEWASAWQAQDVPLYLASYANDFTPEQGLARSRWEAQRRVRVAAPSRIRVRVMDPVIERIDNGQVQVEFRQEYESDTFRGVDRKVLKLRPADGGRWLIVREYTR